MTWRMLDLFSGIGGFSLAAQWCWRDELEIVAFCEIDKYCQKVLRKHWPDVPIIEDIRDVTTEVITYDEKQIDRRNIREASQRQIQKFRDCTFARIDLLTGGFPCQPFSIAGKRNGKADNRFLWPEMFAVIKEVKSRWVVAENVAGIVRMALDDCLSDLEGEGYSTQTVIIPACAVNAPHRRDRVWIMAYNSAVCDFNGGKIEKIQRKEQGSYTAGICQDVADTDKFNGNGARFHSSKLSQFEKTRISKEWWSTEPDVDRVAHGVPSRVDRLKSLGNAIVPQVAYQIFKAIKEIETGCKP